MVRTTVQYAA